MAIYAMSDIHGCYHEFKKLLEKIEFNHDKDKLYLVGDLINRGPKSTKVLDYLIAHQQSIYSVSGNHDLAFLVYNMGYTKLKKSDTYDEVASSEKCQNYVNYIRKLSLVRYISELNIAICHAGILPSWTIKKAIELSKEVEHVLQDDSLYQAFLPKMFGNEPDKWSDDLTGFERIRAITNVFTRMRYLKPDGGLDFFAKETIDKVDSTLMPWFKLPNQFSDTRIIFGHWASLGFHDENNIVCIDTGCVWGGKLTAVRLDVDPFVYYHKKRKDKNI